MFSATLDCGVLIPLRETVLFGQGGSEMQVPVVLFVLIPLRETVLFGHRPSQPDPEVPDCLNPS